MIIKNCYDSHLHWQGIGSFKCRLNLAGIKKTSELNSLAINKGHFRSQWLMGHGWSNQILDKGVPPVTILDQYFPDIPVYFTSHDIHCVWLNSFAIDHLGLNTTEWKANHKGYAELIDGKFTGLFYDLAKDSIDKMIPPYSSEQVSQHLLIAQDEILKGGITHIRDLTCSKEQLVQALLLEKNNQLHLNADLFFKLNTYAELDEHIKNVLDYKKMESDQLHIKGIKVFIDGALGSGGALLTGCYLDNSNGFKLFDNQQLEEIIIKCFESNLEIAFHTIGDQPSLDVCMVLSKLQKNGITGKVHLEHVQILTDECIKLISELNITCHMQPQHWCSDKNWLHTKLPAEALKNIFRWADLESNNVELYFGSDAPVENLSVGHVIQCLKESADSNIASIKNEISQYISYPGSSPINSETHLHPDFTVDKVVVNEIIVYKS